MRVKLIVFGILMCLAVSAMAQPPAVKPACDRTCLEGYIDRYLDAMLAKDVNPKLFAKEVKFTENGVQLPLGKEGLWYGMSGKGTYKFYIPDIETQQVAFIGTVKEGGGGPAAKGAKPAAPTTVAVAIRLKIVNGLITEAEQLAIRPEQSLTGAAPAAGGFPPTGEAVEKMGSPNQIFLTAIPENKRQSREDLVRIANYYFAGLQRNDGKGYYPWPGDVVRFENGMAACGLDQDGKVISGACQKQFESGLEGIVTRIRDRRFVAVDRERGIAFAFGFFDHVQINWTWQLAELFKIEGENIRRIEAVFHRCPYGMNSGWSTYEQGMSEEPQSIR